MKLNKVVAGVALAGIVLTTGACSSSDNKDASKKDKSTDTTMKMADAKDAPALLSAAASHMPMTANVLAGAIAKQFPEKFSGDTESGASALRSGLTALLQEHVYLAGIATGTALGGGDNATQVAALDANSVALSKAITSVYGDEAGTQFLALWRKHIGFFVDYTVGKATKDDAKVEKARTDLEGYSSDFGAFIDSATEGALPKAAVVANLSEHVKTLFAAIDAQAAGSPDATALLKKAADHMSMTAKVLSGAFSTQFPEKFSGNVEDGASELRAGLTGLLQEHVYLAGITTNTALTGGDFKVPAGVLDTNTIGLSDAIGSVYGDAAGEQFKALWRKHIGFFVDYTTGKATDDKAGVEKARADLDGYRADFGAFLASANPENITKQAIVDDLKPHVESLELAIDAQAKEATKK